MHKHFQIFERHVTFVMLGLYNEILSDGLFCILERVA